LTHDWGVEHHSSVWCVEGEYWFTDAELITSPKSRAWNCQHHVRVT
jgi:hypothetical protein